MVKSKDVFMKDLGKVYEISNSLSDELRKFYVCFENNDLERCKFIDSFLDSIEFEKNDENRNTAIRKLVSLKNNDLEAVCDKLGLNDKRKTEILNLSYDWVEKYHCDMFDKLNFAIGQQEFLTEFYRELILGHKNIGMSFSKLDRARDGYMFGVNQKVLDKFEGDVSKSVDFIHNNDLMDVLPDGSRADRCYSMLVEDSFEECGFSVESYGVKFEEEVREICAKISSLVLVLNGLEDEVFGLKQEWIDYFESISFALSEKDVTKLVEKWREVDYAWMKIDGCPLQVGHPLEYYDDVLRNSIEISWDLRVVNPKRNNADEIKKIVSEMFESYFSRLENKDEFNDIYQSTVNGLDRVQLYVGKPLMYFADFFKGLFSAQVVPNDEVVTLKTGKKIFAFADMINSIEVATPYSKLSYEVFGRDFVVESKNFAKNKVESWHKIYSISTIGHEFGHILWKAQDSEVLMNSSGNFKNIEEYKATTGGLVAFFKSDLVDEFWRDLFLDVVERVVKLIAWMKVESVVPYYCEGLIHLKGLFDSEVLSFDGEKLNLDLSREKFDRFASWTCQNYEKQFNVYLKKSNADEFLLEFCEKNVQLNVNPKDSNLDTDEPMVNGEISKNDFGNYFLPFDNNLKEFVLWYYKKYEEIGRETVKLE